MVEMSRRNTIAGTMASLIVTSMGEARASAPTPLLAGEVLRRIKDHVGVPWEKKTVDRFIFGDASTPVFGVATTMMATLDALKSADAGGCNMVITHEPTFWNHPEDLGLVGKERLFQDKTAFLAAKRMAVFHFHDHWHAMKPIDGVSAGMMRQLGWSAYVDPADPNLFRLPSTNLLGLARHLKSALNDRNIRVVGNPHLQVTKVATGWGYNSLSDAVPLLEGDTDVVICGEAREWEAVEYAQDLVSSGRMKGLIILGHVLSEQGGSAYCAEWLRSFVPEVPVKFIQIVEPFWNPEHPTVPAGVSAI
jgi:putative NIF3 family GTP cyclohydrolase 1 type 2